MMRGQAIAACAGLAMMAASVTVTAGGRSARRDADGTRRIRFADTLPGDLPIHEVAAQSPGVWLAVMMTGDGGWVDADRNLASALADRRVSVVAIDSRAYLRAIARHTPDVAAADVDRVVRYYANAWDRPRVVLVGYSRGADLMPFIANRLPSDSKSRVRLVALVGPGERASFEFHWTDIVLNRSRATDLPVLPELERLRGMPMLCVYGADERDSICRRLDPGLATPVMHDGSHRLKGGEGSELASRIVAALPDW